MNQAIYEVAIVGAGPAGCVAGAMLAQSGRRVIIVDQAPLPRPASCAAWVSARAIVLMKDRLKQDISRQTSHPLTSITFYSADLSKSAAPRLKQPAGFVIDRYDFDSALLTMAQKAGATTIGSCEITNVELLEDHVVLHRGDGQQPLQACFLVLATGRGTIWLERLKLTRPTGRGAWFGAATVDASEETCLAPPGVDVIFGLDRKGSFAEVVRSASGVYVLLTWYADKAQARPVFVQLCHRLVEAGRVPALLSRRAVSAPLSYGLTSFALELDSHVGKHTLIVGDAGGFLADISQEGIYPAMWSACIAAEVLLEAFEAPHPQDVLKSFETRWRQEMASYLSPPNTDLHYLLPMVFSNAAMADRMAAVFFLGENL